jgi:hypothetical protein
LLVLKIWISLIVLSFALLAVYVVIALLSSAGFLVVRGQRRSAIIYTTRRIGVRFVISLLCEREDYQ